MSKIFIILPSVLKIIVICKFLVLQVWIILSGILIVILSMTNKYKLNNFVVLNFGLLEFKFYHFENIEVLFPKWRK